jgi:hypothetical protein
LQTLVTDDSCIQVFECYSAFVEQLSPFHIRADSRVNLEVGYQGKVETLLNGDNCFKIILVREEGEGGERGGGGREGGRGGGGGREGRRREGGGRGRSGGRKGGGEGGEERRREGGEREGGRVDGSIHKWSE